MLSREDIIKILAKPSGYAKLRLSMELHPIQSSVVDCLFEEERRKVVFLCGNEVGKSSRVAALSILYSIEMLNCQVICTSATYRQLSKQVMPAVKLYSGLFNGWEFLSNEIKVNGESRFLAFSATSDAAAQGFHRNEKRKLLIIVDEAAGVDDKIFGSIYRMNPTYLIIMGSPIGPEGFLYSACREPTMMSKFKHFKLTKLDCLKSKGWWLDDRDVQDMIDVWGNQHPLVLSSIYAEFATNIEGGIITLADIENCIRTPAIPDLSSGGKHVALDFAAGGDSNVICLRNGNEVKIIKVWKDTDTMNASRTFANELDNLKIEYNISQSDVSGDADGLGIAMIHRLKELGWNINQFHGNATAKDITCKNIITDYWINGCKKIRNRSIIMPNNQELKLQITSRKSFMNQSGKLQLESKEDMRARGIPSPDIGDAFFMALGQPTSGLVTHVRIPQVPPTTRRYSIF